MTENSCNESEFVARWFSLYLEASSKGITFGVQWFLQQKGFLLGECISLNRLSDTVEIGIFDHHCIALRVLVQYHVELHEDDVLVKKQCVDCIKSAYNILPCQP